MNRAWRNRAAAPSIMMLVFIAACAPTQVERIHVPLSQTPASSSTPSPSATVTPTPTGTALPAQVTGDPRNPTYAEPVRQAGAPCGFVDTVDFPLDPPDGAGARGGGDFGRFRGRYDGFHAGEDWGMGASSFGKPVFSVGHGKVTYAQPNGWGADKGVVIVEHVFRDRARLYSFYGHLHPPSIVLRAGQCVERGDLLGQIGDPRSPPHLHFELRTHSPQIPGPGYWPRDPILSGWLPPSATVWQVRNENSPGVMWTRPKANGALLLIGMADGNEILILEDRQLISINSVDGKELRAQELPEDATASSLHEIGAQTSASGRIEVLPIGDGNPRYRYADDGIYRLDQPAEIYFPLPGGFARAGDLVELSDGGLIVAHTDLGDKRLIAVDANGSQLWERSIAGLHSRGIQLHAWADQPYMLMQYPAGSSTGVDLFRIDPQRGDLFRIFSGGTRSPTPDTWVQALPSGALLLGIEGVGLVALDPEAALEAIRSAEIPDRGPEM